MHQWPKVLPIALSAAAVLLGLWFRKSTEVMVVITTVYVILVFLQLQVMREQHNAAQSERRQISEREEARKPKLELPSMCVRRTTEIDNLRRAELGPAWYVNCTVRNIGGSIANHVQPILTASGERLPDRRWRLFPDWIPLGLRWCLDEINAVQGVPTQDRYLVPNRPYMFDLGRLSTYLPEAKFDLCTLVKPMAQANDFGEGQYCFEVTVYSENATPTSAWYLVDVDRDPRASNPLRVEQLKTAPWATEGAATVTA
jgi:hypothetical protein